MSEADGPGGPGGVRRTDGFAPIGDYAIIGDGRTAALVARDGSVDWLALPSVDSLPVFAALLDPGTGGHMHLAPVRPYRSERRYVEDTNVLETTFHTASGSVRVTDSVNVGAAGPLAWSELARKVDGIKGSVEMAWEVAPGTRFGTSQPWARRSEDHAVLRVGDQTLAVCGDGVGEAGIDGRRAWGSFTAQESGRALLALVSTDDEPIFLPRAAEVYERLQGTVDSWRRWSAQIDYQGPWAGAVHRSALALKTLIHDPTGAIAAAPTTSLPEALGGDRNWDYRYAWIRDTSFTLDALSNLALHEDLHRSLSWLLSTVSNAAPDLRVFYKLDGSPPGSERDVPLRGYRDSRPVRAGNGASDQTQLGTFGDLFDSVWIYVRHGNMLDEHTARMLGDMADRTCDVWAHPDAGIWELHDPQHYTISKIGCWVALDRAVKLCEAGQLSRDGSERWRHEADRIRSWVRERCWSDKRQAYTFHADTEKLDASVLLAGRTGFDTGEGLSSTIDAVRAELGTGPLLFRYSGMRDEEGAFLACSFWLVEALVAVGRDPEATDLMEELVHRVTNDVGLMSEEIDTTSGSLLGNFPQGLSHLALINAAVAVSRRGTDAVGRPEAGGRAEARA